MKPEGAGRFVDVGGRRLWLVESRSGSPAVVFESGGGRPTTSRGHGIPFEHPQVVIDAIEAMLQSR